MVKRLLLGIAVIGILTAPFAYVASASAEDPEIVVVVKIAGIPWFERMAEGVEQAGRELGVRASLIGPATADAALQVRMIEDLIIRGVDAIAVVPTDIRALEPVFRRAREQGIVILSHESPFETEAVDWNIELIDSEEYGELAINEIVRSLLEAGVQCCLESPCGFVMLVGGLGVPLHNYWADVALEYAAKHFPGLKELTSRLPTAESVEDSRTAVLDLITTYGAELHAVIGWGSLGPLGAALAVRERGLHDHIIVGGSAIPSTAVHFLLDGSMDWAQLWDPKDAGYAMVYIAHHILEGKEVVAGMEIPGLGPISIDGNVIFVDQIKLMRTAADAEALEF